MEAKNLEPKRNRTKESLSDFGGFCLKGVTYYKHNSFFSLLEWDILIDIRKIQGIVNQFYKAILNYKEGLCSRMSPSVEEDPV